MTDHRDFESLPDGREAYAETTPLSGYSQPSSFMSRLPRLHRPRLMDKRRGSWGLQRFNLTNTFKVYWNDPFHTLLNMPRWRFIAVFFGCYILQYFLFALLYLTQPNSCIKGIRHLTHAVWFSVQTAATIGYSGELEPNPNCTSANLLIMLQVILSALIDYAMLGIVFARFAAPTQRAQAFQFSQHAVANRHDSGVWCISFRIANVRKHAILKPVIQVVLATPLDGASAAFKFSELATDKPLTQQANLKLGLPVLVTHLITSDSPLYGLSLEEMERRCIEVLVFLDGIDASTSNCMQARHSYLATDIRMNEVFAALTITKTRGVLGIDFSTFDSTVVASLADWGVEAPAGFTSQHSIDQHNLHLRTLPFRHLDGNDHGSGTAATESHRASTSQTDPASAVRALCDSIIATNTPPSLKLQAASVKTLFKST